MSDRPRTVFETDPAGAGRGKSITFHCTKCGVIERTDVWPDSKATQAEFLARVQQAKQELTKQHVCERAK